jgi:adenylyltransferase/sulfurtransferase
MEAIKLIAGIGEPLVGRLLFISGKEMTFETINMKRTDDCPVCGSLPESR